MFCWCSKGPGVDVEQARWPPPLSHPHTPLSFWARISQVQLSGKREVEQTPQLEVTFTDKRNTTKIYKGHSPGSQSELGKIQPREAPAQRWEVKRVLRWCIAVPSPPLLLPPRTEFPLQARKKQTPYHAAETLPPASRSSTCGGLPSAAEPTGQSTALTTPTRFQSWRLTQQPPREAQRPELLLKTEGLSAR